MNHIVMICHYFPGLALSFMYLTSMVMVSLYFDKKRPLAYGIACCGSGVGMLVHPLLISAFRDLGWRGILRLQSGLLLSCLFPAFALRPLPQKIYKVGDHELVKQTRHLSDAQFIGVVKRSFSSNFSTEPRKDDGTSWDNIKRNRLQEGDEESDIGRDNQGYRDDEDAYPDPAAFRETVVRLSLDPEIEVSNLPSALAELDDIKPTLDKSTHRNQLDQAPGNNCESPERRVTKTMWDTFKTNFDLSVFKKPLFIFVTIHCLFAALGESV